MKKRILILVLLVVGMLGAHAQKLTVTGRVMDNENLEVIGGNVSLKGAAGVGTITDMNGNYTITVNDAKKDVLVFSYIGMKTIEVPVRGRSKIDVTLEADNQLLEEVVVVGYATVKRKDLTGSVASIKSEDLMKVPTSDARHWPDAWRVCRLYRPTVSRVQRLPFVCVAVSPLLRAMSLFM